MPRDMTEVPSAGFEPATHGLGIWAEHVSDQRKRAESVPDLHIYCRHLPSVHGRFRMARGVFAGSKRTSIPVQRSGVLHLAKLDAMRFGVLNSRSRRTSAIIKRWQRFEALGFDDAWITDDLCVRGYGDFEDWSLLATLARETHRLRIGIIITTIRACGGVVSRRQQRPSAKYARGSPYPRP